MSQLETISREIFTQVRTTIVLNMRFMDMAVFRLKPVAAPVTLATDGEHLYYYPLWLLKRYRGEANAITRDYLHVLLHCNHFLLATVSGSQTLLDFGRAFVQCLHYRRPYHFSCEYGKDKEDHELREKRRIQIHGKSLFKIMSESTIPGCPDIVSDDYLTNGLTNANMTEIATAIR